MDGSRTPIGVQNFIPVEMTQGSIARILPRMGRPKTISDDEVLRIARKIFRKQGHTATTREIALEAGISEAILYQRFGSKEELFFTAMLTMDLDIESMLGPEDPLDDAKTYVHKVVMRLGKHFVEAIPLGLRVMMHPSFDPSMLSKVQPGGPAILRESLADRLSSLARRGELATQNVNAAAIVLLSLAHDWALRQMHWGSSKSARELNDMIDVIWQGLRPLDKSLS
jgi:AcrR family transcriptional regulator